MRRLCLAWIIVLNVACAEGGEGADSVLPQPGDLESLLIRTDFSDDAAWAQVRKAVAAPVGEFVARLKFVDDRRFDGLTIDRLLSLAPKDQAFLFLADRVALESPDHPVLVVDLLEEPGRYFRVIPTEMWAVQNNLVIANASWEDFADLAGPDGVFRGLPR